LRLVHGKGNLAFPVPERRKDDSTFRYRLIGFNVSHPCDKNRNVARMGYPAFGAHNPRKNRKWDTLDAGRRTGRSLPEGVRKRGSSGEESPNSAGQCAG
jgi:hypothetical protein